MIPDPYGPSPTDMLYQYLIMAELQRMAQQGQQPQQPQQPQSGGGSGMGFLQSLLGGGSGASAYSMLEPGASAGMSAITPGANAAWNAGANMATAASTGAGSTGMSAMGGQLAGTGLMTPAPASMGATAMTPASSAAAGTSTLGSIGSVALPAAAVILAMQNMYDTGGKDIIRGKGKSDDYINQGVNLMTGGVPNMALRALGMPTIGRQLVSGKHKDQQMRDMIRKRMRDSDFTDTGHNITLADGRKFDIGKDGGSKAYNVDFNKAGAGEAVGLANPLAAIMTGGDKKLKSDFAGYFANAAMSGGDAKKNVRALYDKAGLDQRKAYDAVNSLNLDDATKRALHNGINEAFGTGGFDAQGNVIARPGAAPQGLQPVTPNSPHNNLLKSNMIPRTGKKAPDYKPGPRR